MTVAELRNLLAQYNDEDVVMMYGSETACGDDATLEINDVVVWHTIDGETN
jgi:hypothetical protein